VIGKTYLAWDYGCMHVERESVQRTLTIEEVTYDNESNEDDDDDDVD